MYIRTFGTVAVQSGLRSVFYCCSSSRQSTRFGIGGTATLVRT